MSPLVRSEPLGGNETIAEMCEKVVKQYVADGTTLAVFEAGIAHHDDDGTLKGLYKLRFAISVEPVTDFKGILPASRH